VPNFGPTTNPTECYHLTFSDPNRQQSRPLSHPVAFSSAPCNLLILREHNLRSQMLYPAALRAHRGVRGAKASCGR